MDIEQRIFELFDGPDTSTGTIVATIVREFGISEQEAFETGRKVLRERGTPNLARAQAALDRMAANIPYI